LGISGAESNNRRALAISEEENAVRPEGKLARRL